MNCLRALPLILLAALTLLPGCTTENPSFEDPARCPAESEDLYLQTFTAVQPQKVDVVFVVDATPQSTQLRAALRDSAATVTAALQGLDWRIGVVAAGSQGQFNNPGAPGCPAQNFVESTAPDTAGALSCLLDVPTSQNVPAAFDSALNSISGDVNPSFFRREARLLIVTVSLFDDCSSGGVVRGSLDECEWQSASLTPINTIVSRLREVKPDLNAVAFAAIVGPDDGRSFAPGVTPEPVCVGTFGAARHGARYWELADKLGPWSFTASVCTNNLQPAIRAAIRELSVASESRYCLGLEPLSAGVVAVELKEDGSSPVALPTNTVGGYSFVGESVRCPTGEVALGFDALRNVTQRTSVDVFFCGPSQ